MSFDMLVSTTVSVCSGTRTKVCGWVGLYVSWAAGTSVEPKIPVARRVEISNPHTAHQGHCMSAFPPKC